MLTWNIKDINSEFHKNSHARTPLYNEKDLVIIPFQIIVPFSPQMTPGKCQDVNKDDVCIMPKLKPNFIRTIGDIINAPNDRATNSPSSYKVCNIARM